MFAGHQMSSLQSFVNFLLLRQLQRMGKVVCTTGMAVQLSCTGSRVSDADQDRMNVCFFILLLCKPPDP